MNYRKILMLCLVLTAVSFMLISCPDKPEDMTTKVERLEKENAELKEKLNQLEKENAELKQQVKELTAKIEVEKLQVGFVYVSPIGDAGVIG